MFRHLLRPVLQTARSGTRFSSHIPHDVRPPHMDEVLAPSGSWQEHYNKTQTRYNLQLVSGIAILVGTIIIGRVNGTLWLNFAPPTPKQ